MIGKTGRYKSLLLILLITAILAIAIWILIDTVIQTRWSFHTDILIVGQFGAFLAGLFTLLSAALLWSSFTHQTIAFETTQLENRLFRLIEIHRDNVFQARFKLPNKRKDIIDIGNRAFMEIFRQVLHAKNAIHEYANSFGLHLTAQRLPAQSGSERLSDLQKLSDFNEIAIAYLVTFFGVQEEGIQSLRMQLYKEYAKRFVDDLLEHLSSRHTAYSRAIKYYGGHQNTLGNYFRHMFQSISYINDVPSIDYMRKYDYAKLYRAQLTTYEQALLFFDSISSIGRVWELSPRIKNPRAHPCNFELITKYNLIKNIPAEFIMDVQVETYYPLVDFETGNPPLDRASVVAKYI